MLVSSLNKNCGRIFTSFRRFVSLDTVRVGGSPSYQEPNAPVPGRNPVWSETGSEIFKDLKSGDKLFVHGATGTPSVLLSYFYHHIKEIDIKHLNVLCLMPMGPQCLFNEDVRDKVRLTTPLASGLCLLIFIFCRQVLSWSCKWWEGRFYPDFSVWDAYSLQTEARWVGLCTYISHSPWQTWVLFPWYFCRYYPICRSKCQKDCRYVHCFCLSTILLISSSKPDATCHLWWFNYPYQQYWLFGKRTPTTSWA